MKKVNIDVLVEIYNVVRIFPVNSYDVVIVNYFILIIDDMENLNVQQAVVNNFL